MRALTIRQPWAELILRGRKRYELRSWEPGFEGRIYVHAGSAFGPEVRADIRRAGLEPGDLPRGALVGMVEDETYNGAGRIEVALHVTRRRFTADEYHKMAEAGILLEDDRVELIGGEIIEMSPIGRHHASILLRLTELFVRTFSDVALVSVQNPIRLSDDTEPQPDLTLVRRRSDFYDSSLPGPEDILLVVEVGDTSVAYDRQLKIPLYGRSGIAESWLIDLNRGTVTIYRDAGPAGYDTSRVVRRSEQLAPVAFPDRVLAVADMLG